MHRPKVAVWLRGEGYVVFSVYDEARGIENDEVIRSAYDKNWIPDYNDKDFGEKVYRGLRIQFFGACLNFTPTDLKINSKHKYVLPNLKHSLSAPPQR